MLFVPAGANSFGVVQESFTGRPASAMGTAVTPAVGSKGSWAQVFASLDHDTYGLLVNINSNTDSAASRNTVLDIGVGAASSEIVLIPDLIAGNANIYTGFGSGIWYYFPISIPAGTRVAVRAQGTVTTAFRCFIQAMQLPLQPAMLKKASYVEAVGMTVPQGTSITAGQTSEGDWTLLGTTAKRCWHWQVGIQVSSADANHRLNTYHIDLAEGDGTDFNILLNRLAFTTAVSEAAGLLPITVGCEVPVPAGRSIYARAQANQDPDDPLFITAYGAGG
jgi:hypothetical protein